jgi:hypothetical protein
MRRGCNASWTMHGVNQTLVFVSLRDRAIKSFLSKKNVVYWRQKYHEQCLQKKERNIMNNILALHEILHETKRRGAKGVVLKLDFEKAYDKVHCGFLVQCMRVRRFSDTWCSWVEKVLMNGIVSVKLNGIAGPYFQSHKGVRQRDPFSPLLFNMAADCLTHMVIRAQQNRLVAGLIDNLIPNGIAILQYADDTIVCLEHDMEKARNMKLLLYMFEQLSGMKINFDKSEILVIGGEHSMALSYAQIFNCQTAVFPLKYLGSSNISKQAPCDRLTKIGGEDVKKT